HNALVAEGNGQVLDLDQAHVGKRRGSKESRTASPTKISRVSTPPSTTKAVMPIQGACRLFLACATNSPSDGEPGGRPKPRKSNVESRVTEPDRMNGKYVRVATIAFGRIWRRITVTSDTPSALAARTYSRLRPRRNSALTTPVRFIQRNSNRKISSTQKPGVIMLPRMISR